MSKADRVAALQALQSLTNAAGNQADEDVGGGESVSESLSKDVFSNYKCSSIQKGLPHPGDIAEATSLSAIPLPPSSYPLWDSIPSDIVDNGKLSQLQLEGVLYACTKHLEFLPSGERAGFFIGDGAGVGKGRQIAGIILDNYARGRRRALWLSTSSDLHHDAERDLRGLGAYLPVINNCQELDRETRVGGLSKDLQEGILFMTYSTLISAGKARTRMQQVLDWVGPDFDGCVVFDECHKAKNFVPGKEAQSTKVATSVLELQQRLPRARFVYCSATGVSEVGNMAYMTRLGLWGPGSAFPNFQAFLDSMKARGVSFLEMLAMEMKAEGYYVARGLSFREAEFMELECQLDAAQIAVYDAAVALWQELRASLVEALNLTGTGSREVWKPFWAAQQRFFKLLCVSLKIPTVVAEAKAALEAGYAVVVGLQTTGEAAADSLGLEPGQACGFPSTTRELLQRFVATHFPIFKEEQPSQQALGVPAEEPSCLQMRSQLLRRIEALELPANFLDELVDELGGPEAVAEMTGRRGRIVRDRRGHGVFQLRAKPDSSEMDSLNVNETAAFMKGKKLVAIVSDAASTGISLHASAEAVNQRRRMHLTIELPWSADKAIQQLGRSHRSNQVSAPIYKLIVTNIGGEKRFAAAVARRLQSLGALTRGDRRAASGIDLSESNFDSPLGRKSLRRMYDHIVQELPALPPGVQLPTVLEVERGGALAEDDLQHVLAPLAGGGGHTAAPTAPMVAASVQRLHAQLRDCVDLMGIGVAMPRGDTVAEESSGGPEKAKDMGDVRRFLNRLLGIPVARQNLLFNYFTCTLSAEIRAAKAEGRYFEGVSDLPGASITKARQPEVLWVDPYTGLKTLRNDLTIDRGMSYEAACMRLEHEQVAGDQSGFRQSNRPMFGRTMYILALQKPGQAGLFTVCRPNTGASYFDMEADELADKYTPVKPGAVREGWEAVYRDALVACMHGPNCMQGPECQVGRRLTEVSIVSGSVVRVWGSLERILERHQGTLSKSDRTMRVVRVDFGAGGHLVGVRYPAHLLPAVVATLSSAQQALAPDQQQQPQGAPAPVQRPPQPTSSGASSGQLGKQALDLLALGAAGGKRTEPCTPVHPPSLAKAFRAPRTVLNYFKPIRPAAAAGAEPPAKRKPCSEHNGRLPAAAPAAPVQQAASTPRGGEHFAKRARTCGASAAAAVGRGAAQQPGPPAQPDDASENDKVVDLSGNEMVVDLSIEPDANEHDAGMSHAEVAGHIAARDRQAPGRVKEEGCRMGDVGHSLKDGKVACSSRDPVGTEAAQQCQAARTPPTGAAQKQPDASAQLRQSSRAADTAPHLRGSSANLLGSALGSGVLGSLGGGGVAARRGSGPYHPSERELGELTDMGFSRDQAERALKVTQGNVERAANFILSGM